MIKYLVSLSVVFLGLNMEAQEPLMSWSFDSEFASTNEKEKLIGFHDYTKGVKGNAIQFDGFTSYLERKNFGSDLPREFTINAWVVLEAYPWFRCPVFDLRGEEKDGVLLAIDRNGMLTAALGQPITWQELDGPKIPLKQWQMLSLSVDQRGMIKLFLNGQLVKEEKSAGFLRSTSGKKMTIGRNAILEPWWDFQYIVTQNFSFLDGCVDEVAVYSKAMDAQQLRNLYNSYLPVNEFVAEPRVLPAGPEGPAEFGANYTRLDYTKQWDRLWRVGDYPDVLVRFADNNCRLVFWRGTSFVPCWVTENGIWYTNEWTETWGSDVTSCAEPLMDRECRFSHVRIIENTPARTIVHWRYGLVDTEYTFVAIDIDGRGEWTDEYYIIYPDGIGIRRIDLHYSKPLRNHDWEEAIVLLSPGQHPDEVMEDPEITLMNMAGETHDYSWRNDLPIKMEKPAKANIHVVNFKSEYKPFYIVSPDPFESKEGKYDSPFFRSYSAAIASYDYRPESVPSVYGWWNHWPVTPVPGDGRWVVNNDRASHFNLTTYTQWKDYYMDESVKTRIMLHGMSNKKPKDLLPLAKSWLNAPELELESGKAYYETAERAYIISGLKNEQIDGKLLADRQHPAVKPTFVLNGMKLDNPIVRINGVELQKGKDYQLGTVQELHQWKTIIWIQSDFESEVKVQIQGTK